MKEFFSTGKTDCSSKSANFSLINYNNSLVSLSSTVLNYFSKDSYHSGLKEFDKLISEKLSTPEKRWKNIIVLLFDGMGIDCLEKHLSEKTFLRKHLINSISSVFPPTTTAATTSILSAQTPAEHAWLAWTLYFPKLDKNINAFTNTIQDTRIQAANYHVAQKEIPYKSIIDIIGKNKAYSVSKFGTNKVNNMKEMLAEIKKLSEQQGEKFIYGYQEFPDNIMHVTGTYSLPVKTIIHKINKEVNNFCTELSKKENTKNTLVIVTADHGHIPVKNITVSDFPDFTKMLVRPVSFESRCANFFVKESDKSIFASVFNNTFNKDENNFILFTKQEILENKIFGNIDNKQVHPAFTRDFLGDFVAIAISDKTLVNSNQSHHFKSHHAGLTRQEMLVPFIAIDISKPTST